MKAQRKKKVFALSACGVLAMSRREYSTAKDYLERARRIAESMGDRAEISAQENNIGRLNLEFGKLLEAMDRFARARQGGFSMVLQEYIPGPSSNHYFVDGFVDARGRICALFARQRLRMYPPLLGNSTLMETVPLSDLQGAIQTIEKFASALGFEPDRSVADGIDEVLALLRSGVVDDPYAARYRN